MSTSCWYHCIGHEAGSDVGPLISPAAKQRVLDLVQSGVDEGANVIQCIYLQHDSN